MDSTITWILDAPMHDRMRERGCGGPTLAQSAHVHGHTVLMGAIEEGALRLDGPLPGPNARVVVHGSILFAKLLHPMAGPGWFCQTVQDGRDRFSVGEQARFLGPRLLNTAMEALSWGEARLRDPRQGAFFIRPDSAWKFFGGTVARPQSRAWDDLLAKDLPDTLRVVIAPLRTIMGEARHLIVDGEVIDASTYRWDNRLDIRVDTHHDQDALAIEVARMPNQPGKAYVCDTALVATQDGGTETLVVELNPFTSAGFYGISTPRVVEAFARIV